MELISALTAIGINLANLIFSLIYTEKIINQSWRDFVRKFYTMMMIRLAIIISLFFILLKVFKMSELYLSLTFIITYFIVLIVEILYLNKRYNSLFFKQTKT